MLGPSFFTFPAPRLGLAVIAAFLCAGALCGCVARTRSSTPFVPASGGTAAAARASVPAPERRAVAPVLPGCPRAMAADATAITAEAVCLLRAYVQLDSTNPPGNEHRTAAFLQAFLAREGIASEILAAEPARANLVARLPAARPTSPKKPALMWVHHMDVVPASAEEWAQPPLSGALVDGEVWGRGALDNKGPGIVTLVAFALAKRLALPLERDLVLLAVADEEAGSRHGARFLMAKHADVVADVAYVLNEGGAIVQAGQVTQGPPVYRVEVAQKAPLWLKLRATGPSGHGSTPRAASASHVLLRGLSRLLDHEFPVRVVPAVGRYFAAMAPTMPAEQQSGFRDLAASLAQPAFAATFLAEPHRAALVRNTLSVTMLAGSTKENVLSAEASAVVDMRLLPGEDPEAVRAEVVRVLAEPAIEVETLLSWQAHTSSPDTPLFAAIAGLAARQHPGSAVVASVLGGFTDCNAFRAAGKVCYGFMPLPLQPHLFAGVHGKDERIPAAALGAGVLGILSLAQSIDD